MTRIFSLFFAATAISAVSAAAVSSAVPSAVESEVYFAPSSIVSDIPLYSATPSAEFSNSTLEDRSIEARASGGYAASCISVGGIFSDLAGQYYAALRATCRTKAGKTKTTTLDLNRCLVNDRGTVRCQTNGGFLGSCKVETPHPSDGNTRLYTNCGNGSGGRKSMNFDLNSCVGNNDGQLVC